MPLKELFIAIEDSDVVSITSILDAYKDLIYQVDEQENTVLLHAIIMNSSYEVIQILISKGADINAQNDFNDAPLHIAASNGDLDLVELLIFNWADLNVVDAWGNSPLLLSLIHSHYNIAKILILNNADTSLKNTSGKDAYYFAQQQGCEELINLLKER